MKRHLDAWGITSMPSFQHEMAFRHLPQKYWIGSAHALKQMEYVTDDKLLAENERSIYASSSKAMTIVAPKASGRNDQIRRLGALEFQGALDLFNSKRTLSERVHSV